MVEQVDSIRILGVRVDALDMEGAADRIEALVATGGRHLVATVNPEFIMRARRDAAFARVLETASLCLADGAGVTWAARRLGRRLPERITGIDLLPMLARRSAERGLRLYLLGAAEGVAEIAAERLRQIAPGVVIAGCHAGAAGPEGDEESLALMNAAHPDILLIAYGAPRQELWYDRNRARVEAPVAIGVGGAFDYLSGRVARAPGWMRSAGLEWLYRLVRQPRRAGRMAALPLYALAVIRAGGTRH